MNKTIINIVHSSLDMQELRSTEQLLLPLNKFSTIEEGYDIYPTFDIDGTIYAGHDELVHWIINNDTNITIDGFSGVYWEIFVGKLDLLLKEKNIIANWINVAKALKETAHIEEMLSDYTGGDDPLFGKIYDGGLIDFFDEQALAYFQPVAGRLNIIYGTGASLAGWDGALLYLEVPKNEIQFRSRSGKIGNLGKNESASPKIQYKRFYFIDWPVLSRHKCQLLKKIDLIIDEQRIKEITWCTGNTLRTTLETISSQVLRVRPWFEPGVWGGTWIKKHINGLNKAVKNYAWSFELIAPENGIILENEGLMLEISFDSLLFFNNEAILGKAAARFGHAFPIRFDFLDTFNGGNLSLQCHPSVAYTASHFGEDFTQDETYYILDSTPDAKVYLGFREDINKEAFRADMENSFHNKVPVTVENYVQTFPAKKHDLFLIPNGTVHCSGVNNMVLEISATPYIYTFKIYDWVRPDLNGELRPLNINRAFENLRFDRKGDVVKETLLSRKEVISENEDHQLISLSTHPDHFYAIDRLEFDHQLTCDTLDQCHILSLVEGECISVKTGDRLQRIYYAETFIVPAASCSYELTNNGEGRAKVVRAYVKDEYC